MSYFYRGRHRKPTHTARNTAVLALALAPLAAVSPAHADEMPAAVPAAVSAPTGILDAIAECESRGSYTAQNPSSSASGKYQFLDSTWKAMGGSTARAKDASPAEQDRLAAKLLAQQGTAPWAASQSCWAGKASSSKPKAQAPSKPKHAAPAKPKAAKPVTPKAESSSTTGRHHKVELGDTLSGIALDNGYGRDWQKLYEKNRSVVGDNPNLILPGQDIAL